MTEVILIKKKNPTLQLLCCVPTAVVNATSWLLESPWFTKKRPKKPINRFKSDSKLCCVARGIDCVNKIYRRKPYEQGGFQLTQTPIDNRPWIVCRRIVFTPHPQEPTSKGTHAYTRATLKVVPEVWYCKRRAGRSSVWKDKHFEPRPQYRSNLGPVWSEPWAATPRWWIRYY